MNSFKKSLMFAAIKFSAFLLMLLPIKVDIWIGRCFGRLGYYFLAKKRQVVYANLKTVFSATHSPAQIHRMTREVFINFIQSAIELLCLPKLKRMGFEKFVELQDKGNIDDALKKGKGVIFLAIHSGSWELASVVGGIATGKYYVVANDQSKFPELGKMLNEYRTIAGANVILAGNSAKEIIRVLHQNGVVSLVLDQGGKTGLVVPFLGKSVSMSTGAIRLALKYGCAVCPVWIERRSNGKHLLKVSAALELTDSGDLEKDLAVNITKAARHFESLIKEHPLEYMWFYKMFKYSAQKSIVVLDDGRTGHLRQSQSVARHLTEVLKKKEKSSDVHIVPLRWRSAWSFPVFSLYSFLAQFFSFLKNEGFLKFFLTGDSFKEVVKVKADFVISCGSKGAGVNYILSQEHLARSVSVLTPGLLPLDRFSLVVLPEHDKPKRTPRTRLVSLKVSPNLINAAYLKEQSDGLSRHYSHLKASARLKFGVLMGGNTKGVRFDEAHIRQLLAQIKSAALHYNADILITTSRRTPVNIEQLVLKELGGFQRCLLCLIANQHNVPEAVGGILGLSDLVIVSGESISMVSEALSSKRSTIVFSPHGDFKNTARDKYEDFVLKLSDQGYLMISSVDDIKSKISLLLNRKISLKPLEDASILQKSLEAFV